MKIVPIEKESSSEGEKGGDVKEETSKSYIKAEKDEEEEEEIPKKIVNQNKEEEKEVQRRNKAYYRQSPLEDIFHACYRRPKADEEGQWFTAAEMFRTLCKRNPTALRGISAKQLSYRLTAMGFKPRHTDHGNYYHVVQTGTAA